ncbi:Major facilitator superfamily domain-containing protein 12 [Porites harrisoni]
MENQQKSKLNVKQRFSCGFGIVLNEVFRQMYISFSIIFLMQVIGLSASQAGLAMLIGQTTDAFTSPITGFLGDRVRIPFISKKLGRRKSWHLVGTVMMAGGLPLLFNRCLVCNDYQGVSWLQPFYYYCIMVIISLAYNILEINHLSITFTAAGTVQEGAALSAIRTVLSFVTGIYVYVVAWGLLGQDGADDLGPESVTQFAYLVWIVTGTGIAFTVIFYIGTKEPAVRPQRKINTLKDPVNGEGLFQASQSVHSMVFEQVDDAKRKTSTIFHSLVDIFMSSAENTEVVDKAATAIAVCKKTSLVQRFVEALFSNGDGNSHEDSEDKLQISEVKSGASSNQEKPGSDLITRVARLDQDCKKSLVFRFVIDTLVYKESQRQPETTGATAEEAQVDLKEESNKKNTNIFEDSTDCTVWNGTKNTEIMEGNEDHNMKTREHDLNGADKGYSRRRRRGMSLAPEEVCKLGIHNLGYQNETCGLEMRTINEEEAIEPVGEGDAIIHGFEKQMSPFTETTKCEKVSFSVPERNEVRNSGIYPLHSEMTAFSDKETQRKVSLSELKENGSEKKETGDESNDKSCKSAITGGSENRKPKTTMDWLKTPGVYKVAVIVTCARLVQDAVYAYLPLYLTERLGFGKQSIAYFPLVLLVGGAIGSTLSNKLNSKLGNTGTYLIGSLLVISASVYYYFQTTELKLSTYAPVILTGSGMSIMYVMALAFAAELVKADKVRPRKRCVETE